MLYWYPKHGNIVSLGEREKMNSEVAFIEFFNFQRDFHNCKVPEVEKFQIDIREDLSYGEQSFLGQSLPLSLWTWLNFEPLSLNPVLLCNMVWGRLFLCYITHGKHPYTSLNEMCVARIPVFADLEIALEKLAPNQMVFLK